MRRESGALNKWFIWLLPLFTNFLKQRALTYRHLENLIVSANFSTCGKFRYQLTIEDPKSDGVKTVCVVMQNPSEAGENRADRSVQFLEKLIFKGNYNVFKEVSKIIIVNQYAFIQKKGFLGRTDKIGADNNTFLKHAIKSSDIVLIGWGKMNHYEERKETVFQILANYSDKILLETKKHPSRGFYEDFIRPIPEVNRAI